MSLDKKKSVGILLLVPTLVLQRPLWFSHSALPAVYSPVSLTSPSSVTQVSGWPAPHLFPSKRHVDGPRCDRLEGNAAFMLIVVHMGHRGKTDKQNLY